MSTIPAHLERVFTRFHGTKPRPLSARTHGYPITGMAANRARPAVAGMATDATAKPDPLPLGSYDLTAF